MSEIPFEGKSEGKLIAMVPRFLFALAFCLPLPILAEKPGPWIDLLAGNELHAWEPSSKDAEVVWTMENGILHFPGREKGQKGQNLLTKQHFLDFEFRFEWKISEAGNSGVKYRTENGIGLEYQVLDDDNHKDGDKPSHRSASLYDIVAAPDDKPINAVGEWNKGKIVAKRGSVTHWLNGTKVVEIDQDSGDWEKLFEKSKYTKYDAFGTQKGPVLLQDHQDPVWFRNLEIREIPRIPTQAELGEPHFTLNCAPCHQLNSQQVGPSMVELALLYKDDPDTFLEWTVNPGKKRPLAPQMPSMAHLGEEKLNQVYAYVLQETKGMELVRRPAYDRYDAFPEKHRRPRIERTFVDGASPAAIVVALPGDLNVIWDATHCRLRSVSRGELDSWNYWRGNGNGLAEVGETLYSEPQVLFSNEANATPSFLGYRVDADGYPIFRYKKGSLLVQERITGNGNRSVFRHFSVGGLAEPLLLDLPATGEKLRLEVDQGGPRPEEGPWVLSPGEASLFSVTLHLPPPPPPPPAPEPEPEPDQASPDQQAADGEETNKGEATS
ncbi:MAG: family 16 glycoside hydrolase [Verrucomicrobiota bacterium]